MYLYVIYVYYIYCTCIKSLWSPNALLLKTASTTVCLSVEDSIALRTHVSAVMVLRT